MVPLRPARGAGARHLGAALNEATPLFSVVVPARGDEAKLLLLLDALSRQTIPDHRFEILIAFDGAAVTAAVEPRLQAIGARSVSLPERRGPGAARNAGARAARGAWLAFTEEDCLPAADWLERAAERIDRSATLQAMEGETVTPKGRPIRRRDGTQPNFLPTNLFVLRRLFDRVGGYCEYFFDARRGIYFREDSDFGFSLEEAGATVVVEPALRVTHPDEHPGFLDPLRWARRYEMDPLLERRHPDAFRSRIEVARFGPFVIRRPFVRTCWAALLAIGAAVGTALLGDPGLAAAWLGVAVVAFVALWAKWGFHPLRLPILPVVPLMLVAALARGQSRTAHLMRRGAANHGVAPPSGRG